MRGKVGRVVVGLLLGIAAPGCAGVGAVRYVYQDGQFGVIGLPENSSHWPTFYREHAEKLMAKHFPEGYEIVRAEEIVEGSRTLTVGGSSTATISPAAAEHLLKTVNVGRTRTRSQSDTLALKESRIIYKKASPEKAHDPRSRSKSKADEYAELATLTPSQYHEPAPVLRAQSEDKGPEKPKEVKDAKDDETKKGKP